MRKLLFETLLLLSESERAARRVTFHPKATIIKGANDTGKSSLLKSIFQTFGADPPNLHDRWKNANVTSAVRFSIDGERFTILRHAGRFSLFDSSDKLLGMYRKVVDELGPKLADLCGFRLQLREKNGTGKQAPPAFMFLPFYCDQDQSWTKTWSGFDRLAQFQNAKSDSADYHAGIKPNEYYLAKIDEGIALAEARKIDESSTLLKRLVERIEVATKAGTFDISASEFSNDVEKLLSRCATLQDQEQTIKNNLVELHRQKDTIRRQKQIARAVEQELQADFAFLASDLRETLGCPLCGTEYENSFASRFGLALDEDQCRSLIVTLSEAPSNLNRNLLALFCRRKLRWEFGN